MMPLLRMAANRSRGTRFISPRSVASTRKPPWRRSERATIDVILSFSGNVGMSTLMGVPLVVREVSSLM